MHSITQNLSFDVYHADSLQNRYNFILSSRTVSMECAELKTFKTIFEYMSVCVCVCVCTCTHSNVCLCARMCVCVSMFLPSNHCTYFSGF